MTDSYDNDTAAYLDIIRSDHGPTVEGVYVTVRDKSLLFKKPGFLYRGNRPVHYFGTGGLKRRVILCRDEPGLLMRLCRWLNNNGVSGCRGATIRTDLAVLHGRIAHHRLGVGKVPALENCEDLISFGGMDTYTIIMD